MSVLHGQERKIFGAGFRWVYFTPLAEKHSVTVALDNGNVPLQAYVDITQGNRLDPDGFPAIDDVFLDVLAWVTVQPDGTWLLGTPEVIDVDELDAALTAGDTGLNSIPPIREKHPNGLCCAALQVHAVQTRIFSYSLCSEK